MERRASLATVSHAFDSWLSEGGGGDDDGSGGACDACATCDGCGGGDGGGGGGDSGGGRRRQRRPSAVGIGSRRRWRVRAAALTPRCAQRRHARRARRTLPRLRAPPRTAKRDM